MKTKKHRARQRRKKIKNLRKSINRKIKAGISEYLEKLSYLDVAKIYDKRKYTIVPKQIKDLDLA